MLGVSDGREGVLCVESHLERLGAMSAIAIGAFCGCLEVENYRRRCIHLETIAYLLAGERVGGSVGGSVGSHDFDLVSTVGNQGCVEAIRLVSDLVLEETPPGYTIAAQVEGVDQIVAVFVVGCPSHGDGGSVLRSSERRCGVGAGDIDACGRRGKCNVDRLCLASDLALRTPARTCNDDQVIDDGRRIHGKVIHANAADRSVCMEHCFPLQKASGG